LGNGIIIELVLALCQELSLIEVRLPISAGYKGSNDRMLMEVMVKMFYKRLRQVLTAGIAAIMLLSSLTAVTTPVLMAAPVAQTLESEGVAGVLTGGQFAKIWLKITPNGNGNVVVTTDWDRDFPENNGVGFYILNADGLARVLSGSARLQEANLSAGSRPSQSAPDNQLGAILQATGGEYTIVLYNDSASDASFTLKVTNASISDDSNQVRDLNATPTSAAEEGEEGAEDEAAATETPVPAATEATTATTTTTTTTTTTATAVATAEPTTVPAVTASAATTSTLPPGVTVDNGVVRAQEMHGELATQNAQHYFDLEISQRDAEVTLTLGFDPQDSSELARRLNFWVLDTAGFTRYTDASTDVVLSEIAIAAGSGAPGLLPNQRQAKFTASGVGPYVVIVYNNSTIPGTYSIRADGGILVDDSSQSLTAQQVLSGTGVTASGATTDTTTSTTTTEAGDTTTAPTTSSREGEPGGVYVVQSGDTLSLIARDIYGEIGLWEEICAYNSLADCNSIEVGQEIRLPTREEINAGITSSATPAATATATPAGAAAAAAAAATATATPEATETMTGTEVVTDTETTTATGTTTSTTGTSPSEATEDSEEAGVNLVAALEAAGSFSTLLEALEAANLTAALEDAGPFTIFAPTDSAFEGLPSGALNQLLANPTGQLTQILLFHVLPGSVMAEDIDNGMQAVTQQGKSVGFEVSGTSVKINGANVVAPDIMASNGVIHGIDTVILPPPD
jgi:uncharacterized surface protein with fasciclin (FAS1) repeats